MTASIDQRKSDHLTLCATGDVGFHGVSPLFECVRFVHNCLPEVDLRKIDLGVTVFGKRLRAPILIAAMTGGTEEALRVNRELAGVAEQRGYAFGLGSQRAMFVRPAAEGTFQVRNVAPSTVVFANIGIVQARDMRTADVERVARSVGADAICIHMNPAMEVVQPGGDHDFTGGIATFARLVRELPLPVIAKETGCGIGTSAARRLCEVGVRHVDVSGAGGTSWVGVETERAKIAGDARAEALGHAFWNWGIPTAASVALVSRVGFDTVIATGGVGSGLDIAKAIALGATAGGIARPVLRALYGGGVPAVHSLFDQIEHELRAALLLTGSSCPGALRDAPRLITGELAAWMAAGA